jgi:hypothetical protein
MPWSPSPGAGGPPRSCRVPALGRGHPGRPGGPERPPGTPGHRTTPPMPMATGWGRPHHRPSRLGQRRPGIGCGWPWSRPPATATRRPPPPWSARPPPTASTSPSWLRWPRPTGPSPASTVAPGGPAGAGARPACGGCTGLEAGRRWPNRSSGHDRSDQPGSAAPDHPQHDDQHRNQRGDPDQHPDPLWPWHGWTPSQRLCCRARWCHSGHRVVAGAERRPRFAAMRGPRPPPAAPHVPAVCLLDGLPPRRLRGQGSLRAPECSLGLQPSLDRSGVDAARRHRSPGAGEEPVPDQQARGTDRGGPPLGPPPEPAPAHPSTRKEDQAPVRTTIATEEPAPSLSPEEGTACPTPTSPSSAT